jgi:hypothetical protein
MWAVKETLEAFRLHRVPRENPKFMPTPGEIYQEAMKAVNKVAEQAAIIERILHAIPAPQEDDAMRARVYREVIKPVIDELSAAADELRAEEHRKHLAQVEQGNEKAYAKDPNLKTLGSEGPLANVRVTSGLQKYLGRMASGEDQGDAKMF